MNLLASASRALGGCEASTEKLQWWMMVASFMTSIVVVELLKYSSINFDRFLSMINSVIGIDGKLLSLINRGC